jgi:hypothetical protein
MSIKTTAAKATGELVAAFLSGAWRLKPPALDLSLPDFEKLAPRLLTTGAGALGWWRVRETPFQSCAAAQELHQAYRLYTLESRLNESRIETVLTLLRAAGVEPILIKGWAAARYYPEQGLRPYGDIDLCVRRRDYQSAARVLVDLDPVKFKVDLHSGFGKFGLRQEEDLYARSVPATLGATDVRILGAEDHLRVVSYHLMREGAWRPLWLVDVAAALEFCAPDFDWDYCLGESLQARAVESAISLAHLLLGADIDHIPQGQRFNKTPRWLVPTVLKEWGSTTPSMQSRQAVPMLSHLHQQGNLLSGVRHRWPNPIEATTTMHGPFNDLPRLPFQIGNSLFRLGAFLAHLPKAWNK